MVKINIKHFDILFRRISLELKGKGGVVYFGKIAISHFDVMTALPEFHAVAVTNMQMLNTGGKPSADIAEHTV